jgi:hypothetical protein
VLVPVHAVSTSPSTAKVRSIGKILFFIYMISL